MIRSPRDLCLAAISYSFANMEEWGCCKGVQFHDGRNIKEEMHSSIERGQGKSNIVDLIVSIDGHLRCPELLALHPLSHQNICSSSAGHDNVFVHPSEEMFQNARQVTENQACGS